MIPYTQTYESGTPSDVTIGTASASTNTWAVVPGAAGNHVYENTLTGSGAKGFSSIQFPALGTPSAANNFEMSATVQPVSVTSNTINYTAGLRFLASSATSVNDSFVADLNIGLNGGRMRVVEWTGSSNPVVYPNSDQTQQPLVPGFSISKSYLLDVKGTYDAANDLTVVFTVTEVGAPANTQTYTYSDTTPRTGSYFGIYDSIGSGGTTMKADFDNLSVVPEPMILGLLAVGALALVRRRRRA